MFRLVHHIKYIINNQINNQWLFSFSMFHGIYIIINVNMGMHKDLMVQGWISATYIIYNSKKSELKYGQCAICNI